MLSQTFSGKHIFKNCANVCNMRGTSKTYVKHYSGNNVWLHDPVSWRPDEALQVGQCFIFEIGNTQVKGNRYFCRGGLSLINS